MAKPAITTRATKGSALTWTEGDNNFTNLKDATITLKAGTGGTDVVSDLNGTVTLVAGTNVTLSGDNSAKTVTINSTASGGASAINDLTDVTITGSPSTGQVIKWSTATSQWTNQADAGIDGLYADPNPSLGGNLTVMGYSIVSAAAGDIAITPNSTGNIVLDGQKWPQADGTANQILKTDGAGQLSWTTGGGGISNVVEDTTPQLGGNLDVNGNSIVSASNGNIVIEPNGTGDVQLNADTVRVGDSNANATITTNGTGDLILSTNGGSNSGAITIQDGLDNDITLVPAGTGKVHFETSETRVGINNTNAKITTKGTGDLTLDTNSGTNSGSIVIADGADANISITPNGTGKISLDGLLWPNADGTADQVLKTNGSGTLSFTTVSGGASTLNDLTDVTISGSPMTGQVLKWNSPTSQWTNQSDAGIDGLYADPNPSLGGNLTVMGYSIVSASNGNIAITPNGTGKTNISSINYNEGTIYDLGTTGGTIAPNVTNGNVQKITLSSALTLNAFTSPVAGQSLTLIIYGGTAYTAITSTMKFSGGIKTLTGTAGCIDIVSIYYDGTTYFASLGKGFA